MPTFNRPPRQQLPSLPPEDIDIPAPPQASASPSQNWLIGVMPVMGIGIIAVFYVIRAAAVPNSNALFAAPLFILAIFAIGGTVVATRWRNRDHQQREQQRLRDYVRTLEKKRARLQAAHNAHLGLLETTFPAPEIGVDTALSQSATLWERRPEDHDFLLMRVGVGRVPSPVNVSLPDPDAHALELDRAMRLGDRYRTLPEAPVVLSARESIGVCGRRDLLNGSVRAMLCSLALSHAPSDLHIYLVSSHREDWDWLRWLPHVRGDERDRVAFDPLAVRVLLGDLSQRIDARQKGSGVQLPHLLVVFDNPQLAENEAVYATILNEGASVGASALCLTADYVSVPGACSVVVDIRNNGSFRCVRAGTDAVITGERVDTLPVADAEPIARGLASISLKDVGSSGRIPRRVSLLDVYGVQQAEGLRSYIARSWTRDVPEGMLPFPVTIGREGLTTNMRLLLDEDHHGPHGVLAGTTGSGKSELLQTLVCALALEHDPRLVNFLLIDFKGGSTFRPFDHLPHTVGTVTNLDGTLIERTLAALRAEIQYRQRFLKNADVRDITQYYRFYGATQEQINAPSFQPLPHLFVIVDEFAQLAKQMPDFMSELVRTAQMGRSLGLHLILGTQSPMEVITEEMNANLQFRICLRVQNAEASRAMLRRPDAAYLPPGFAGRGYFMVGEGGVYKQFQTAYAGGDASDNVANDEPLVLELLLDNGERVNLLDDHAHTTHRHNDPESQSVAAVLAQTIRDHAAINGLSYMPPLLLPPLPDMLTLADAFDSGGRILWDGVDWTDENRHLPVGNIPLGWMDDLANRTQDPLWVHLNNSENGGHLLVVGGPGSGKTTLLQTLALSLATCHAPDEMHLYTLSFGGGGLNALGNLPHAERVVGGMEMERVRRLFRRLLTTLETRQASRKRDHTHTIVLLVDGYEGLRDAYYEQHMAAFERLIAEGRGVNIFVVFTASTVTVIPDRVRSLVPQRIALQLSNTGDYLLAVGEAPLTDDMPKGRGYIPGSPPLACQISLPTLYDDPDDLETSLRQHINDMRQAYARQGRMQAPEPITELPSVILLESLERPEYTPDRVITTLGQSDDNVLSPFKLDWTENGPHMVVTGPPAGGKTNLLNAAVLSAAMSHPPGALRILLVDVGGRSLLPLERLKHVIARVTNSLEVETQFGHLTREMAAFQGAATNGATLPKTLVVMDDYEIVADLLSMNLDLMRQLRDHARLPADLGLHIWVAGYLERVGDPLLKQLLLRRSGFALRERDALHNLNVRAQVPAEPMPPGRAYFAQHNRVQVVQTALVDDVPAYVDYINDTLWPNATSAMWSASAGSLHAPRSVHSDELSSPTPHDVEIDIDGLIDDLLAGE
jgi:S-DNA-T family DNA segregation ATPase FtsK/SpoIIIE